ncbi:hypothetical protein [Corynebacterium sp. HS2168-gen11]|uniref:hypothetical protein n=1 Tax=Corynebacterium sp. HS2168-gen11 TaxID=2974027 RepID=UPI00216B4072|nr:hypothetical protein [Corynebacterium sp. HS2168-gen11]MCS4534952.1 hypothetical protein [Corynebacterium sp. HS2168-gen11]
MTNVQHFYALFYELENLPQATSKKCEELEHRIVDQRDQTGKAKQRILEKADAEKQTMVDAYESRFRAIYQQQQALENSAGVYGAVRKNKMAPSGKPLSFVPAQQTLKALKKEHADRKNLDLELRNLQKKFAAEKLHEEQKTADLITAMAVVFSIVIAIVPYSPLPDIFSHFIPFFGELWAGLLIRVNIFFALLSPLGVAAIICFLPHGFMRRRWDMKHGANAKRPIGNSVMWYFLIAFGYFVFIITIMANLEH